MPLDQAKSLISSAVLPYAKVARIEGEAPLPGWVIVSSQTITMDDTIKPGYVYPSINGVSSSPSGGTITQRDGNGHVKAQNAINPDDAVNLAQLAGKAGGVGGLGAPVDIHLQLFDITYVPVADDVGKIVIDTTSGKLAYVNKLLAWVTLP